MLPTSTTGAATRDPSAAWVHTIVPTRTSVTRISPFGLAIRAEAARQIGQFGGPLGARELTVTTPSARTVPPTISYAVFCLKKKKYLRRHQHNDHHFPLC